MVAGYFGAGHFSHFPHLLSPLHHSLSKLLETGTADRTQNGPYCPGTNKLVCVRLRRCDAVSLTATTQDFLDKKSELETLMKRLGVG